MNTQLPAQTANGPVPAQDSNLEKAANTYQHKDFLGRKLAVGDRVIMMAQYSREFRLAQVIKMTPKKVKVAWDSHDWATYTSESARFIRVEGPDLTWYLLSKDSNG
jgi:hypothetical protein